MLSWYDSNRSSFLLIFIHDNRMLTERAFYCFPLFFCANSLAVCGSMTISTNRRRTVAAAALGDVNWPMVVSAAVLSGIVSVLTSVAGLPEVDTNTEA